MGKNMTQNLVNIFNDIDEMRGIVRIVEPAPACQECDGFGRLKWGWQPIRRVNTICRHCRGTGWGKQ